MKTYSRRGFALSMMATGTLAACGREGAAAACAVTKLGRLRAEGVGLDRPAEPAGFVAEVALRLQYSLRWGNSFAVAAHGDGAYLITPWTVELNQRAVWSMPRINFTGGIDAVVRFP